MADVRVLEDAVVSYGQQLLTLRAGDEVHADLGNFLAGSGSGVKVEHIGTPTPARRGRRPAASEVAEQ